MTLQEKIKANTIGLFNSLSSVTQPQAEFKPSEGVWSILQCSEHIFLTDVSVSKIISTPSPETIQNDKPELFSESKLNHILITKRSEHKIQAPDIIIPSNRFKTPGECIENIRNITDRIVTYLNNNDITTQLHTVKHPRMGDMTKTDWIHFMIAHTSRHVIQIEEVKKLAL